MTVLLSVTNEKAKYQHKNIRFCVYESPYRPITYMY